MYIFLGTIHGVELAFIWGHVMMDLNEEVRNDSLYFVDNIYNEYEFQYAMFLQELWTNFAKYG